MMYCMACGGSLSVYSVLLKVFQVVPQTESSLAFKKWKAREYNLSFLPPFRQKYSEESRRQKKVAKLSFRG
jgi:hypothetical protein